MLSSRIEKIINLQINREIYSSYFYFDMANYYSIQGLDGFSHWFTYQAQEELEHAVRFRDYLLSQNVQVALEPVLAPPKGYENLSAPLYLTLEHEKQITAWIMEIQKLALEERDFKTLQMLDWFIKEQEEEEENANDLILRFTACGNSAQEISVLDAALSIRGVAAI